MTNIFDYDHTAPTEQCSVKVDEHNNSAVRTDPTHEFSEPDAWPIDSRLDDLTRDEFMMLHYLFESRHHDPVLAIRICPDGAPILRTKDVLIFPRMKLVFDSYEHWADSVWYRYEWQESERFAAWERKHRKSAVIGTAPKKASKGPTAKAVRITGDRLNSEFMAGWSTAGLRLLSDLVYNQPFDHIRINADGSYETTLDESGKETTGQSDALIREVKQGDFVISETELEAWFGNNALPAEKATGEYIMPIVALVEKIGHENARFIENGLKSNAVSSLIFNPNGTFNYVHDAEISPATELPNRKAVTLDFHVQYNADDLRTWLMENLPRARPVGGVVVPPAVAPKICMSAEEVRAESAAEVGTRAHQVAEAILNDPERTGLIDDIRDSYSTAVVLQSTGYERLAQVFAGAFEQASQGKGKERHANDLPFHEQRMQSISHMLGSADGMAYQSIKKLTEGLQLPTHEMRVNELYGVLNYVAGIVIFLEDRREQGYED